MRRSTTSNRGSAAIEIVLLAPVLVLLTLIIVFFGRAGSSLEHVRHAADAGARAASLATRQGAQAAATAAVLADLDSNGLSCTSISAATRFTDIASLVAVTVDVACVIDTTGLSLAGVTQRTVHASSTEVIDRYRSS